MIPRALLQDLLQVRSVGVITGAGVSAESGLPTYRGVGGIYDDPIEGDRMIEALTGSTLRKDPDRTWRAIARLAKAGRSARPNSAHMAIRTIEKHVERFVLLTQNVDGLHQKAGSRNVIDIHGTLSRTRCLECGRLEPLVDLPAPDGAPRCPICCAPMRPDVVLFGEPLPNEKVARLETELIHRSPDLLLVAGTSAAFPYIVWPVQLAHQRGKTTVEINPEPTPVSRWARFCFREPAGRILPEIAKALSDRIRPTTRSHPPPRGRPRGGGGDSVTGSTAER